MAKGISFREVGKLLTKAKLHPASLIAGQALETTKTISIEKFGYDFTGLIIKLVVFYAVAYLIEWYFRAKIAVEEAIANPDTFVIPVFTGLFGIGGISLIARHKGIESFKSLLTLKIIWSLTAVLGMLIAISEGAPDATWLFVLIFAVFSGVWMYYQRRLQQ